AAGLVCYYNSSKYHYLYVTTNDEDGRHIQVMSAIPDSTTTETFTVPIPVKDGPVHLRVDVDYEFLRFAYRFDAAEEWIWLDDLFDASILSDEATATGMPNFTGGFVGVACQDTAGTRLHADFDRFSYVER